MKIRRKDLRRIIESLCEGDVIRPDFLKKSNSKKKEISHVEPEAWMNPEDAQEYRSAVQGFSDSYEDDEKFSNYLDKFEGGIKYGNLTILFDDDDYIIEHKDPGKMYGDPTGIGLPYGDDIFEEDLLEEDEDEDDADAERNRELARQDDYRAQTATANASGGATNDQVKAAQANDARQALRGVTAGHRDDGYNA